MRIVYTANDVAGWAFCGWDVFSRNCAANGLCCASRGSDMIVVLMACMYIYSGGADTRQYSEPCDRRQRKGILDFVDDEWESMCVGDKHFDCALDVAEWERFSVLFWCCEICYIGLWCFFFFLSGVIAFAAMDASLERWF